MDKKEFYSKKEIAGKYEDRILGSIGAGYFDQREKELIGEWIEGSNIILDIACGTGRFSDHISKKGFNVIGIDYSGEMLRQAVKKKNKNLNFIRGNAFNLPFKDSSFDSVIAMHFVYHYSDINGILKEMHRVVKKGGVIIFDTNNYSIRSIPLVSKSKSGVFLHPKRYIEDAAKGTGLEIIESRNCFLISQLAYRYFPNFIIKIIKILENIVPKAFLLKTFWRVRRIR